MVKSSRNEKRTSSVRVSTVRGTTEAVLSQIQAPKRLSGRRVAAQSITQTDQLNDRNSVKTNESETDQTEDDDMKERQVGFRELSAERVVSAGEEECEDEDDEDDDENETIQAPDEDVDNNLHNNSTTTNVSRRHEACKRARLGRKFRRKGRKSQQKAANSEKVG